MPQKSSLSSLLTDLRRQGVKALAALNKEITKKEKELEGLKETAAKWGEVIGKKIMAGAASLRTRPVGTAQRIDWNEVLAGLPMTFKNKDVQQKSGKPIEQVYSGLSRWVKDKKIKKNQDGTYQKISATKAGQKKNPTGQKTAAGPQAE